MSGAGAYRLPGHAASLTLSAIQRGLCDRGTVSENIKKHTVQCGKCGNLSHALTPSRRGKCRTDGTVGWVTAVGNTGTTFLEVPEDKQSSYCGCRSSGTNMRYLGLPSGLHSCVGSGPWRLGSGCCRLQSYRDMEPARRSFGFQTSTCPYLCSVSQSLNAFLLCCTALLPTEGIIRQKQWSYTGCSIAC